MTDPDNINADAGQCLYRETIELPRPLEPDEYQRKAQEVAQQRRKRARVTEEFKRVSASHKGALAEIETTVMKLMTQLSEGVEISSVEVDIIADWNTKTCTPYRVDTGEPIIDQRRLLTEAEVGQQRQTVVPGTEPAAVGLAYQVGDKVRVICGDEEKFGECITINFLDKTAEIYLDKDDPSKRGRRKKVVAPIDEIKPMKVEKTFDVGDAYEQFPERVKREIEEEQAADEEPADEEPPPIDDEPDDTTMEPDDGGTFLDGLE